MVQHVYSAANQKTSSRRNTNTNILTPSLVNMVDQNGSIVTINVIVMTTDIEADHSLEWFGLLGYTVKVVHCNKMSIIKTSISFLVVIHIVHIHIPEAVAETTLTLMNVDKHLLILFLDIQMVIVVFMVEVGLVLHVILIDHIVNILSIITCQSPMMMEKLISMIYQDS